MKNLGFGMMRLPVTGGSTDFDYAQLNQMVDAFLAAGCTYFDTSYVYHNGKSEEATRKALVERHPREAFTVATKFPTFLMVPEEKIDEIFQNQLANLGVDFRGGLSKQMVIAEDGTDITPLVETAVAWLAAHSF